MSFASEVKKEINNVANLKNKELVLFELIGYMLSSNMVMGKRKIKYSTENEYNINRFSRLLDNLEIVYKIEVKGKVYVIDISSENMQNKIEGLEVIEYAKNGMNDESKRKSIVRGIFMGSGTVTDPEKTYHLEIAVDTKMKKEVVKNILDKSMVFVKEHNTNNRWTIYIKEAEEISKFLALIGANKAVMYFEDMRVQKEMNGKVNRLVNCKSANLSKTINASVSQIAAIKKIQENNKMDMLDENLRELACIRIEYPEISLVELGQKLKKPIGKSGTNYRLKKIVEIADEL